MAISLNRCLHLRWVQTLKFYFCNYMCSTFSHIFMSGLGCLQHLWILPLFCRCTLLYFLVFNLFPNFLASLCSCIFLFYFGHRSELVLLPVTFLSHWFDSPASLFYSLFIRNPIFPFFCCQSVCSPIPIRILSARYIFSSSRFLLLICRPGCIIQSALNGFGCIQLRAD